MTHCKKEFLKEIGNFFYFFFFVSKTLDYTLYSLYTIKGEKYGSTKRVKTQNSFKGSEVENFGKIRNQPKPKSIDDVKQNAFDWVWFYDKAIEKAKEFEKTKIKEN